jgi:hypothetical protein
VFNGATDPRCWAPPGATVWGADATPAALAAWADAAGDADGVGLVDVR